MTTPRVVAKNSASLTCCGVALGCNWRYSAATPVVWGVAIDVRLMVLVAVLLVFQADVMSTPGANQSTQLPMFAHRGLRSVMSVALIVMASGTRAGEVRQASFAKPKMFPLPAAIA